MRSESEALAPYCDINLTFVNSYHKTTAKDAWHRQDHTPIRSLVPPTIPVGTAGSGSSLSNRSWRCQVAVPWATGFAFNFTIFQLELTQSLGGEGAQIAPKFRNLAVNFAHIS